MPVKSHIPTMKRIIALVSLAGLFAASVSAALGAMVQQPVMPAAGLPSGAAATAAAAATTPADCTAIADSQARLACYDRLHGRAPDAMVDRVYLPGQKNGIPLAPNSAALFFLARARPSQYCAIFYYP